MLVVKLSQLNNDVALSAISSLTEMSQIATQPLVE